MFPLSPTPLIRKLALLVFLTAGRFSNGAPLPPDLADSFHPPTKYENQYGNFRSPLLFENGTRVTSPADWRKRREEILQRWMEIMGPWPALLEKPKVEILDQKERDNLIQKRVRIEIAPGQTLIGYLLFPPGKGKFPAVLVPYYDAETSIGLGKADHPLRDFAYQLAKRGFVTLAIGSPGPEPRTTQFSGARCQPLSYLAYVAANCANALANLPEVNPAKIGVVGHSFGGKWAMFASCLSERFACGVWSDPGIVFDEARANVNYWEPWYLGEQDGPPRPVGLPSDTHPRTGAYKILVEKGMDLTELHALMAPRPFLVSGGAEDLPERWPALNHAIAVNKLLGFDQRVALTSRKGHAPTAESNEQIYHFFEHFLLDGQPAP